MLSAADAGLVQRDPSFPGLATLLDPEAFVAALKSSIPDIDLGSARSTYVRYKPGVNCLVAYRLKVEGKEIEIYAKAHGPDAEVKLRNAYKHRIVPGPLAEGRITLEDPAIVVSIFPNDGKLKSLRRLANDRLLRRLLPDRPDLQEGILESIRYKPERRYVGRLLAGGRARAVLKVYTGVRYQAALLAARTFGPREHLRLARLLGRSNRHHALAFEWLPGHVLSEAVSTPQPDYDAVSAAGAALAELHAQRAEGLATLSRETEAIDLRAVADDIGVFCPGLAGQARDLARRLAARIAEEPFVGRPVHGDFDAGQVVLSGEDVAIIDLDRAGRGDPAADLGSFVANLERDALRGDIPQNMVEPLGNALLDGYGEATRYPVPTHVGVYAATGLLRLAPEPFRYREPGWPERTAKILERAAEMLEALPARSLSTP